MTESEVPQGNQDGASANYMQLIEGSEKCLNGHSVVFKTTDGTPWRCMVAGCQYYVSDMKPSDSDADTKDTLSRPGGGSQDSIDLEWLLNKYELTENGLPAMGDLQTTKDKFREAILAWHNTQLKASIPEKIAGCSEHPWGSEDCTRWFECPMIYGHNRAIDLMQAKWGKA